MAKRHLHDIDTNVDPWEFVDDAGTFRLDDPQRSSYLYFPLVNEAGIMSAITPKLHGDVNASQHEFLTPPTSVEDLHNKRTARNFWVYEHGAGPWSAAGNSATQIPEERPGGAESVSMEGGLLYHEITRENDERGLRAAITNFAPVRDDMVELMRVRITNTDEDTKTITPTAAVPIYGRSADNVRDHRHVTSLLQETWTDEYGVLVRPTLSFDERGHTRNETTYGVLGTDADGTAPESFYPVVEDFIGEGGNLEWPEAVVEDLEGVPAGTEVDGYESLGGLRFETTELEPGETAEYVVMQTIWADDPDPATLVERYGSSEAVAEELAACKDHWREKSSAVAFDTGDDTFDQWMRWVTLQPVFRRLFGNSFLPYHDYGRGGRGWRDLWQDILSLLLTEPDNVTDLLYSNFAGVRFDGSNATIIGDEPGAFEADRNNIPRVWMDHGAWPWLTTRFYLDLSGDLQFLLRDQQYYKDLHVDRASEQDDAWSPEDGTELYTDDGEVYEGTVLEHLLVQHLTQFFNVGEHNVMRLEDADWNDAMDMAPERGESVAFTALYAWNLRDMSDVLETLQAELGVEEIEIAREMQTLLDTLTEPVDYDDPEAKQTRLDDYLDTWERTVSGEKVTVAIDDLAADLQAKADWLYEQLRDQEFIESEDGHQWFNGYYDDSGRRVEGDHENGVRMTLTGQVFTLMGGIATDDQTDAIVEAADEYLYESKMRGYRLNTDFDELKTDLGRGFGFAFGHKENGAMFSHMAVMYANALYRRGKVEAGHKVLSGIYEQSKDFEVSRIYPGIPEYFSERGRGMYTFLTGSGSWLLLTTVTEVFGVKGRLGDLRLEPKLLAEQFEDGEAAVTCQFADRRLDVTYHNPDAVDVGAYEITEVTLNGDRVEFERTDDGVVIDRDVVTGLDSEAVHDVDVTLE